MFTEIQIQNFLYEIGAEELNSHQVDSLSEKIVKNQKILIELIEMNRIEEEQEAMREGEWNSDPYDHIEEKGRDYSLGEQEAQIRNDQAHL